MDLGFWIKVVVVMLLISGEVVSFFVAGAWLFDFIKELQTSEERKNIYSSIVLILVLFFMGITGVAYLELLFG